VTVENDDQAAPSGRQRKIIHVDMDAFYASVEQRDNPDLRGKPVAVGGSRERGVVAAASYEARKFGVRSAMPSVTAKRQCPDLIFVKPRFEVYKAVSQQIREIFAEHTPIIEPLSLDEAYLDVTENLQNIPLARDVALGDPRQDQGGDRLNASAGISYNKFLAKLASDHRKPNGQYVITPEMGPAFVETLPVGKFHGIGPATSAKMNALGSTPASTCATSRSSSCKPTSARPARTTTGSREASTTARSAPTGSGNRSAPRTRSPATSPNSTPWSPNCSR
jgi:DNA polymerase-4